MTSFSILETLRERKAKVYRRNSLVLAIAKLTALDDKLNARYARREKAYKQAVARAKADYPTEAQAQAYFLLLEQQALGEQLQALYIRLWEELQSLN